MTHSAVATIPDSPEQPQNLGAKIDQLYELRERKRELDAELKTVSDQMTQLETELMELMDKSGLRSIRGTRATVSISETTVPIVEDWDLAHDFIKKNDAFHLLERRMSSVAWREMFDAGETIPGTVPFIRRKPSVRKT